MVRAWLERWCKVSGLSHMETKFQHCGLHGGALRRVGTTQLEEIGIPSTYALALYMDIKQAQKACFLF